ncbi:hypothetical protein [Staphylococcus edaphicus]|uniref:Glycosyl hydrolase n=1 Tax=Staphylococcus edaphicus TaxID=1955013 RepID=A0A2C6WKV4_9STAP|nr:hypothetical protein [Staphylococcus edaphicus]PHK48715.1 hypothetical protein BTJ66_12160 [Staphylococcus edaphicus]UQW81510.1 hypothetical protein MNY58_13310 [Staphylococcus edaphicus]
MAQFAITYDQTLLLVTEDNNQLHITQKLNGMNTIALAQDPLDSHVLYCGTFDRGLWQSKDKGNTWHPIGTRFTYNSSFKKGDIHMTSITAISVINTGRDVGTVLVGTEPSALFISYDQGHTFELLTDFDDIPGKSQWFFPPRPHTHHVKCIDTNRATPEIISLTIEAGGFIQSEDGGQHWSTPQTEHAPIDIHVLKSHPRYPNKLYGVLGDTFLNGGRDTYIESDDYGSTWTTSIAGIRYRYGYGLAVNTGDPDNLVIATSSSPFHAHQYNDETFSTIYYLDKTKSDQWQEATKGLPAPEGTIISAVTESDSIFYIANNKGIFSSNNKGENWSPLALDWPVELTSQHAHQFIVLD